MPATPEPERAEPGSSGLVLPDREKPDPAEPGSSELVLPDREPQPAPDPAELVIAEHPVSEPAVEVVEPAPAGPLGNLVAAHLQRVEVAMLGRILTTTLANALPAAMVRIERRRSLAERLLGRPGRAVGISVTAGDKTLTFRAPDLGVTEASVSHTVHGVVLSTTRVSVADWLVQLGELLNAASAQDAATRDALQGALLS